MWQSCIKHSGFLHSLCGAALLVLLLLTAAAAATLAVSSATNADVPTNSCMRARYASNNEVDALLASAPSLLAAVAAAVAAAD